MKIEEIDKELEFAGVDIFVSFTADVECYDSGKDSITEKQTFWTRVKNLKIIAINELIPCSYADFFIAEVKGVVETYLEEFAQENYNITIEQSF